MGTTLSDIIVPELFNPYVVKESMELSALYNCGVVQNDAEFDRLASQAAPTVKMPFFTDLSGESENITEGADLIASGIASKKDVAVIFRRAKMWSATDLSAALAGRDPLQVITSLVGSFWARDMQKELIALLNGVFGSYNEAAGGTKAVYTITIGTKGETGDKITVDGTTYTFAAATSASAKTIAIGTTYTTQAGELKNLLAAQYGDLFTITQTGGVVTLTQDVAGDGAQPVVAVTQATGGSGIAATAATTTVGVPNKITRAGSNILDITGMTGDAAKWSASAFIDAQQLLGDAKSQLSAVVMHSATESALRKMDLITTEKSSTASNSIDMYMGKRVIIDDGCPVSGTGADKVYSTYLFGGGAVALGNGSPAGFVATEVDRDKKKGSGVDYLINRRTFILHPRGIAWQSAVQEDTESPTRAEVGNAKNWLPVYEPKQIRIVQFKHKLG